ncbi:MAG: 5-oxoprolinase subunit PxpB [Granulosicoccus sp.]
MTDGCNDANREPTQVAGSGKHWTALYAGDSGLVLQFGETIDRSIVNQVTALDTLLHLAIQQGSLTGVLETVPTFRSLAIFYDPCVLSPDALLDEVRALESQPATHNEQASRNPRHWQLPVLYGSDQGPDLDNVSSLTGLTPDEVISLHASCVFSVYMLGFLPGYAFLGDTPKELHLPRRSEPRLRVPAGSVAIAMQLTGIYPWESPGGWHIIGNCPVPMFNAQQDPPALLRAGDLLSFKRVDQRQFEHISNELRQHSVTDRSRWLMKE